MNEFCNRKCIDIRGIKWGYSPCPLLPQTLRNSWEKEQLPKWVTEDLLIANDSTYAALSDEIWKYTKQISQRIQNFLAILIRSRFNEIRKIRCFQRPWPAGLKHSDVSWSSRTRNCLYRGGLLEHEQKIVNVAFGDLFHIDHMGALSILDFCCTLEAAMDHFEQTVNNLDNSHEGSNNLIGLSA